MDTENLRGERNNRNKGGSLICFFQMSKASGGTIGGFIAVK
jgi:hypothetical protein